MRAMKVVRCDYDRHAAAILAIFNDAILNTTALYDYKPRTMENMRAWFDTKAAGKFPVIGLENEAGELMGFGSYETATARKMRAATGILWERKVDFEVDGEMHADTAIDPVQRARVYPHSRLKGAANALIMPTLDAANIAYESIKTMADALAVGPILIGTAKPAHILTPSVTARGIVNMTAVAVVEAQACGA